ncbi:unnamed protein product [Caenorhabditis nigoni]
MRAIQLVLFLSFLSFLTPCNFQHDGCTPNDNTTYMFAYSNDIDPEQILKVFGGLSSSAPRFVKMARIRFDMTFPEEIEYHDNLTELMLSVNSSLPDPSLSYNTTSNGSDMISVLQKFLENTKSPICGSRVNFLVKRLPTEVNVESIVAKLRKFRVEVYFAIAEDVYGGNTLASLNEIASRTNGASVILENDFINWGLFVSRYYTTETLVYAASFNVSGEGTIELPPMTIPNEGRYWFLFTYEDDPLSDAFQSATLTGTNTITNSTITRSFVYTEGFANFDIRSRTLEQGIYTVKLEYKYANQDVERLLIQCSTAGNTTSPDYWVPYNN